MALGVQLGAKYVLIGGPREYDPTATNPPVGRLIESHNPSFVSWGESGDPNLPIHFTKYDNGGVGTATWTRVIKDGPLGMDGWNVITSGATAQKGFRGWDTSAGPNSNIGDAWIHAFYWKSSTGHYPSFAANATFTTTTLQWPVPSSTYQLYIGRTTFTSAIAGGAIMHMNPTTSATGVGAMPTVTNSSISGWSYYRGAYNLGFITEYTPGYVFIGDPYTSAVVQDGMRAVLNDDTDPDFVGYAMDVTGLDGADVRENSVDNIEADGALHGEFYQSRRPVTITAAIGGNVTPTTRNARLQRWSSASRALRTRGVANREAVLRWQPAGAAVEVFTTLRRQQKPTTTGLMLKEASIAMVASDPRIYATTRSFYEHTPSGSGTAGRTYDRSYDVNFNWSPQRGTFTLNNIGDADAPVRIEFVNAMSTFALQNLTTGEEISINGSITNGQTVIVDTGAKTIKLQDGTNLFDRIELSRTRWWGLAPGVNTLSFLAETFDASARVRVYHRPAWA